MGGVAGHMAHLSEDLDLTFDEIVSILQKVASADIQNATEKVDGQNLFLTVADGEIRTARNNGDVKKGGMTTDEYISKWKGHPAENAFTNGFKAISAALRKLTPEVLEGIFSNGERYVNMEIMYPANPNIISYSAPNIVLHGLQYFGSEALADYSELSPEEKEELKRQNSLAKEMFPKLSIAVDSSTQDVASELWTINGPKAVALNKLADGSVLEEVTSKIQSFSAPVGMGATLGDYVSLVVRKYAEQVGLPENILEPLLVLMLDPDEAKSRGIKVVPLKKGLPKELQSVVSKLGSKTNSRKYIASVLKPLEIAISDFAIEVLRGIKSFFVDEHDEEVQRMRDELQQAIVHLKALQSSGDEKMGELVDKQLAKLGKIENLASSLEGVVFEYPPGSNKIYKLTGAFAMSNQIIGRARRSGMAEEMDDEVVLEFEDETLDPVIDAEFEDEPTQNETVAIVPGAFKPPHMGHVNMVEQYAQNADRVIVLISAPTKGGRKLPNGREITAEDAKNIWDLHVGANPKIEVYQSSHASPINAAYEISGRAGEREVPAENMGMEPILPGSAVILGASSKDNDTERWTGAKKYVRDDLTLIDPQQSAVTPLARDNGEAFSATSMRELLGDILANREELKEFAGPNVDKILRILGFEALEETTSMQGGSISMSAGAAPCEKKKKRKKSKKQQENIDITLVDDVIRLIMERGISQ
jgi:cytidyltransferase-like protein